MPTRCSIGASWCSPARKLAWTGYSVGWDFLALCALTRSCKSFFFSRRENAEVDETVRLALSTPLRCLEAAELGRKDANTEAQRTYSCFALFTLAYHAHRIITTNSDMLLQVLSPYFDERGLRHPTSAVHRSKTADFLLKFLEKVPFPSFHAAFSTRRFHRICHDRGISSQSPRLLKLGSREFSPLR